MPKYDKDGKLKTVQEPKQTKYDGKVFDRFLEHCATGGSIPQFCLKERISRVTFDTWIAKYDTKNIVKPMGKTLAEGWWMQQANNHLVTMSTRDAAGNAVSTKFDTNLYKYVTGGRFGHHGEKALLDIIDKMQSRIDFLTSMLAQQGKIAQEPEYTIDDSPADNT